MIELPQLVLASGSQYRKQQLDALGLHFHVAPAGIDESQLENETASELVHRLAKEKATKVQSLFPDACVIGSDQVCTYAGEIYGKPGSIELAVKQLHKYSSNSVIFYTALTVLTPEGSCLRHTDQTVVKFRCLTDHEIRRYIEKEMPLNCAGSFKVESLGLSLFESVQSTDPSALMGLPLIKLCEYLRVIGFQIP